MWIFQVSVIALVFVNTPCLILDWVVFVNFSHLISDDVPRYTPHTKLPVAGGEVFTVLCCQWEPIQNRQENYVNWYLVVKNGNVTLLLTSSGQEWQFDIATDIQWWRMAIWHCYWHLVVKNGNLTLLLTSSHEEWQFDIATDIQWWRMAIWHCYWHLVVKNGNLTLLLTSSHEEWQFDIATDI